MAAEDESGQGSSFSILKRKTGPLPNWVWMGIVLLAALVFAIWRRNQSSANENTDDTADSTISSDLDNQESPPVFILPQNPQPTVPVNVTVNNPGTPPSAPPIAVKPPSTNPPPVAKPVVKPTAPVYDQVKTVAYTKTGTKWQSTLWGIAKQYGYGSGANNWTAILNDPKNAALKKKMNGDPKKLPVGAIVFVKRK